MPASTEKAFYAMLDSIAETTGEEDAIQQNKRIKEAQIAEDIAEPNAEQAAEIHRQVEAEKHHTSQSQSTEPCNS